MDYKNRPAIVMVGYNRVDSISRLLNSVNDAYYPDDNITLIISLDKSDATDDIVKQVKRIGFKHGQMDIRTYPSRLGLKEHILRCGDLSEEYGSVIILEDDLVVARSYYEYVCQALDYYGDAEELAGISLYSHAWNGYSNYQFTPQKNQYDTYLGQFSITWGQCWTAAQWKRFKEWYYEHKEFVVPNYDVPEQIEYFGENSWGRYYACYVVDRDKYYVMPYTSLSTNYSEPGEHGAVINTAHQVMLMDSDKGYEFRFAPLEQAIRYDMFFERVIRDFKLAGIESDDICFDLNAQHRRVSGKQYLLTLQRYDELELVTSFGLMLRPIEENVLKNVKGEDIFLYKLTSDTFDTHNDVENYVRLHYELYNHWKDRLLTYAKKDYRLFYLGKIKKKYSSFVDKIYTQKSSIKNARIERENVSKSRLSNGHVLMFHDISDQGGELTVTFQRFKEIMERHRENGYGFVSLDNLAEMSSYDHKCVVTFDDGYRSNLDCVPYLTDKRIPFCIYVIPSRIGEPGYLTEEDLRSLAGNDLCTIGNHTMSHIMARKVSSKALEQEIRSANDYLEEVTGGRIEHFAFPYGSAFAVSASNISLVKKMGLFKTIALTMQMDLKPQKSKPMVIGRYDATREDLMDVL